MSELGDQLKPSAPTQSEDADNYEGEVIRAPVDMSDTVGVGLNHFADYGEGGDWEFECRWMPRVDASGDPLLPSVGDIVLVAMSDERESWVVCWVPA